MKLGDNILKLRKKNGLSQEQLGEQIEVTRQTISNWELGETNPNPEQLKRLSKALNVSIDELLDNEVKEILMKSVSNTERLAGIIIKILKVLGVIIVLYLVFLVIMMIGVSIYATQEKTKQTTTTETSYHITDKTDGKEFEAIDIKQNIYPETKYE